MQARTSENKNERLRGFTFIFSLIMGSPVLCCGEMFHAELNAVTKSIHKHRMPHADGGLGGGRRKIAGKWE